MTKYLKYKRNRKIQNSKHKKIFLLMECIYVAFFNCKYLDISTFIILYMAYNVRVLVALLYNTVLLLHTYEYAWISKLCLFSASASEFYIPGS